MTTDTRIRSKPAPLSVQVTHAEREVLEQKRLVVARATSLHQSLRERLTSPMTLLFAGGLGIFAEALIRRQMPAPSNVGPPAAARDKLFPRLLKVLAFARLLGAVFPVKREPQQPHAANDG
jgi:hypothetical protein